MLRNWFQNWPKNWDRLKYFILMEKWNNYVKYSEICENWHTLMLIFVAIFMSLCRKQFHEACKMGYKMLVFASLSLLKNFAYLIDLFLWTRCVSWLLRLGLLSAFQFFSTYLHEIAVANLTSAQLHSNFEWKKANSQLFLPNVILCLSIWSWKCQKMIQNGQ